MTVSPVDAAARTADDVLANIQARAVEATFEPGLRNSPPSLPSDSRLAGLARAYKEAVSLLAVREAELAWAAQEFIRVKEAVDTKRCGVASSIAYDAWYRLAAVPDGPVSEDDKR